MNKAIAEIHNYFESINWHHSVLKEKESIIATGVGGLDNINSGNIEIYIDADDDGESIHIVSIDYIKFPKSKVAEILTGVNACNDHFRWVKFVADIEHGIIRLEDDAVLDMNSAGEEAKELVLRMASIADEAYPIFMKAIYS